MAERRQGYKTRKGKTAGRLYAVFNAWPPDEKGESEKLVQEYIMSNHPAAGPAVAAIRIPLFKVESALRHAGAGVKARAALGAALALVPPNNRNLRMAILEAADAAEWKRAAQLMFDRTAMGAAS